MNQQKLQLIINAGSDTNKYSIFRGEEKLFCRIVDNKYSLSEFISQKKVQKILKDCSIQSIGFRVVHGGHLFQKPTKITPAILKKLKKLDQLAPLHNPPARKLIEESQEIFPKLKKYLFFDTAFHAKIPEVSWRYAIPRKLADKNHLRRYGFHGLVFSSIVNQLKSRRKLSSKLIICHLGSGCSIAAIKDSQCVDTSMGFTPLEGLVMGSRAGDLDPGLILYLMRELKMKPDQVSEILNYQSGLKALANTNDMRKIIQNSKLKIKKGISEKLALEIFCTKVAKYIAAYIVSLGGVDQIVFSGGIGENAPIVRQIICEKLKPFKISINTKRNCSAKHGQYFHKITSRVKTCWMKANEADEMNRMLVAGVGFEPTTSGL